MKKPVYIRCPRCELNYIQKKDKYCSVCKAEMEAKKIMLTTLILNFVLFVEPTIFNQMKSCALVV